MVIANFLLDRTSAALIIFAAFAALTGIATMKPAARIGAGLAGLILAACLTISGPVAFRLARLGHRTPFGAWPSADDHICNFGDDRAQLSVGARVPLRNGDTDAWGPGLYPGAIGILNYDTYVLGYSGYLLPLLLAATLGYAIYRRYVFIVLALNVAILGFLLSAGRSLNLWDYVIDPVAWLLAIGSWAAIAINLLRRKLVATPSRLAAPQPS